MFETTPGGAGAATVSRVINPTSSAGLPGGSTAPAERSPAEPAGDRRGLNPFAVAAFIVGLLGGVPLSVLLAIVALVQLRRQPRRGKGFAVAGLALSGVWLLVATLVTVVLTRPDSDPAETDSGAASRQLASGDCVSTVAPGDVASLPVVPCAEPHEAEIFAVFSLRIGEWPGEETVIDEAERGCQERLGGYAAALSEDPRLELMFLHPGEGAWARGDREVTCLLRDPGGQLTGSLRG